MKSCLILGLLFFVSFFSSFHFSNSFELDVAITESFGDEAVSTVVLDVQTSQDFVASQSTQACYPTTTAQCNLRSAWSTCKNFPNTTNCIINLPYQTAISFNSSYGALKLSESSNIRIQGQNTTILQVNPVLPLPMGSPFPYITGTMSNTNSAQQNYQTACTTACFGDILIFSSCAYDTTQNTFFRLYLGSTQLVNNDNFCGLASQIIYRSATAGCQEFCLRIGCSGSTTCSTTVSGEIVKATKDGQFISYLPQNMATNFIPKILLQGLNLLQFGSLAQRGGVVSITGNCYLQLSSINMYKCAGNLGGCVYVSDNIQGYTFLSTVYFNTSICARGAVYIQSAANINLQNVSFSNIQARETGGAMYLNGTVNGRLQNIDMINCSVTNSGGGAYFLNITGMIFSRLRAENVVAGVGGLFYMVNIRNSAFENIVLMNASAIGVGGGGAIYAYTVVNTSFSNMNWTNLSATGAGGSLVLNYPVNVNISDVYIANTRCTSYGGAIYLNELNNCSIKNITVRNSSTTTFGGAFYIFALYNSVMNQIRVSNSSAQKGSGSFGIIGGENFTLSNFGLSNSTSTNGIAGCMRLSYVRFSLLANITLTNCTTIADGGGMYLYQVVNTSIVNSTITRSFANGTGGGIYAFSTSQLRFYNATFSENQATYGGGSYWDTSTDSSLIGVNISNNRAIDGGGIYLNTKNVRFMIIDETTFRSRQIVETNHPYVAGTSNLFLKKIQNINAKGWLVVFDANTNLSFATSYFVDGSGQTVYSSASICNSIPVVLCIPARFPGVSAPILYIEGNNFNFTLNTSSQYYDSFCQGSCYGIKFYAYPLLSEYIDPYNGVDVRSNFLEYNTASRDGGGLQFIITNQYSLLMNVLVRHNVAKGNAGGMYLMTSNDGSYLCNINAMNNSCGGFGGGINLFASSFGFQFRNLIATKNNALAGGGLYIGAGNGIEFGLFLGKENFVNMSKAYFEDNIVSSNGGGLYIDNSNTIIVDRIVLQNNSASTGGGLYLSKFNKANFTKMVVQDNRVSNNGGGIYIEEKNVVMIRNSTINFNQAKAGDAGGIYSQISNIIFFNVSNIAQNSAGGSGGGIKCSSGSSMYMLRTTITGNSAAAIGGGLYLKDDCQSNFAGSVKITNNNAVKAGGGIAIYGAGLWTMNTSASCQLLGNVAARGSALFFKQLVSSIASSNVLMENVSIDENKATEGGTVYWLFDSSMLVPPSLKGVKWGSNNVAPYGVKMATQAVKLLSPALYHVEVYQQYLTPAISVQMLDYYGALIPLNDSTTVDIELNKNKPMNCFDFPASLVESTTTQKGLSFSNGEVTYSDLQAYCVPEGNFTITFTANLGDLDGISVDQGAPYYISNDTLLQFRPCRVGEYLSSKGECVICPESKFSLQEETVTSCGSCFGIAGVVSCYGNQIILAGGYWRRYDSNEAVMSCPLKGACVGGNITGDLLCAAGYTGALCAVCASGYYSDDGSCVQCSSGGLFSPVFIVIISALSTIGAVAIVAIYIFYMYLKAPPATSTEESGEISSANLEHLESAGSASLHVPTIIFGYIIYNAPTTLVEVLSTIELYYLWCKTRYTQFMTQMKIILSTYQIAMSTAAVLSVTLPKSFMNFSNALSFVNVNISAVLPINCAADYTFIDQLVIATLTPIIIAMLLVVMFMVEYNIERYRIQKNTTRQKGDKQRAFDRIKDTYLNYLFYLSYLVLPSVTTMIFQTFLCTNVDPYNEDSGEDDYYLTADMSISCMSTYYYNGLVYAIVMVIIYPIGIPSAYFLLLYYCRDEIKDRKKNNAIIAPPIALQTTPSASPTEKKEGIMEISSQEVLLIKGDDATHNPLVTDPIQGEEELKNGEQKDSPSSTAVLEENLSISNTSQQVYLSASVTRIAFLWQAYQPQYWYWEIIETTRRLMLTAFLSVCGPGTTDQTVFSVLLAMVYIKLYSYFAPYDNRNNNVLAEVGQFQVFFTFFGGMIMQANLLSDKFQGLVGFLMVVTNLAVVFTIAHFQYLNSQKTMEKQKSMLSKLDARLSQKKSIKSDKGILNSKPERGGRWSIGGWNITGRSNQNASPQKQRVDDDINAIELSDMQQKK